MIKKALFSAIMLTFAVGSAHAGALGERLQNLSKDQKIQMGTLQVMLGGVDGIIAKRLLSIATNLKYDKNQVDKLQKRKAILQAKLDVHSQVSVHSDSGTAVDKFVTEDSEKISIELDKVNEQLSGVQRNLIEHGYKSGVRVISGATGLFFVYELGDRAYSVIVTDTDPGLFPVIISAADKTENVINAIKSSDLSSKAFRSDKN